MSRVQVLRGGRLIHVGRGDSDGVELALSAGLGIGIGLLAGMITGHMIGGIDADRLKQAVKHVRRTDTDQPPEKPSAVERTVRGALSENPTTRQLEVQARALGEGIVELTGTAPDVEARELAGTVARGAAGTYVVVNHILVDGVDTSPGHSQAS